VAALSAPKPLMPGVVSAKKVSSLRVYHRPDGRPSLDETGGVPGGFICAVGTEVGFCLVRRSPVASLTRGASMTPQAPRAATPRSTLVSVRFDEVPTPSAFSPRA
jgi:hypothetical protein